MRVKTEDMAKFAELFLQKGVWNGKQVLPKGWVEEASTAKIIQHPDLPQSKKDSSDWEQGYCYQMWRCRHNAYRGDGAFGQFMIVMPDEDAALAITAETADMQDEINLVWQYLLPAFQKNKLPANNAADAALAQQLKTLALAVPKGNKETTTWHNTTFTLDTNKLHLHQLSFQYVNNNTYAVKFVTDAGAYTIPFGNGKWNSSETGKPGPSLTSDAIENRYDLSNKSCRCLYMERC